MIRSLLCVSALAAGSVASAQTLSSDLIGSITGSGVGSGDTTLADDTFNGRFGPAEIDGVYTGGDEVWEIVHGGGQLDIIVEFFDSDADLDIFLYGEDIVPNQDDTLDISLGFTTTESLGGDFAAGTYYVLIDGFYSADALGSAYSITVVPAPAGVAMLGLGGLVATRRRR